MELLHNTHENSNGIIAIHILAIKNIDPLESISPAKQLIKYEWALWLLKSMPKLLWVKYDQPVHHIHQPVKVSHLYLIKNLSNFEVKYHLLSL